VTARRPAACALLVASTILLAACGPSLLRQAQIADVQRDHDLAVAKYMAALREDPNNRDAQLGLDRAKLRASDEHLARGRRFYAMGRYDDAVIELQLASELNPTNATAEAELRQTRLALRAQLARPEGGATELESLLDRTHDLAPAGYGLPDITLPAVATGQQSTTRLVYLTIAKLAGLSVTFDSQFRDTPAPISLLSGLTVKQALDAISRSTATFYQLTAPGALVVVNDTPAKRREYADEVVRQFAVQNADLRETMDALRVVADARYISAVTGTNAILVRDTAERVQVIGRLLAAFDKARPELVVDVEILEVDRGRLREYGLQIASPGSAGIDGAASVGDDNGITLQTLRNLSQADVLMTNIPALYYRLLKTDTRTRTLANPHIRMTDGVAASARFGQRVPVPTLRITPITQGGVDIQPQTQFDYQTVGVNIGMTARTHPNDEVTLALNVELSSLGNPGFDGLPTFGSRNVNTVIRLRDGETNILAGLIREDERVERQTIPGLGDVPVLGPLFARNRREAEETDVVIMLTPHIVRVLDLEEADLRPLRLPREGTGGVLEPLPILPAPVPAPAPLPTPPNPVVPPPSPAPASQGPQGGGIQGVS
jgi:general secretion pathway protein D